MKTNSIKTIYLTFNDSPSGIFKSQVIDRVEYLNEVGHQTQLISFLPRHNFHQNKKLILNWNSKAIILKQLPALKYWWVNLILLLPVIMKLKTKTIIGRSIYATNLGLVLRKLGIVKQVVYDGRGAVTVECKEFKMVPKSWLPSIKFLEYKAINHSNQQLAVSNALIEYWRKEFSYEKSTFTVIPCTIGKQFESVEISEEAIQKARKKIGFETNDIVIAYSGSLAGWQFKEGLEIELAKWLEMNKNHKLLFLCKPHEKIDFIKKLFPNQFIQHFVKPEEVPCYLIAADYGLLVREDLITNQVASPVKFAEYLACGLKVIISEGIGDFSEFVKNHKVGYLINENETDFNAISITDKNPIRSIGLKYFSLSSTSQLSNFIL